jgi:hypothetical protein
VRISPAIGMLAIPALAACGGSNSQSSEPETTGATSQNGPAATTVEEESAQGPQGGPAPPELQGTWLFRSDTGPLRLYLREDGYAISAGGSVQGDIVVDGDEIAFFNSNGPSCPPDPLPDVGCYRWRVTGEKLHLRAIGEDPCRGRTSALANRTFVRG